MHHSKFCKEFNKYVNFILHLHNSLLLASFKYTVMLVSNISASYCQHVSCNGGHCLSKDQSYICVCPVGYDGINCQQKGWLFIICFQSMSCKISL